MATTKKSTARKATTKKEEPKAQVVTTGAPSDYPVRVPAGGIDPRLVEQRDAQREAERNVQHAHASEPAALDPKLAKIREETIKRERELADRSFTEPPVRA